jgi:hypothetical protein
MNATSYDSMIWLQNQTVIGIFRSLAPAVLRHEWPDEDHRLNIVPKDEVRATFEIDRWFARSHTTSGNGSMSTCI